MSCELKACASNPHVGQSRISDDGTNIRRHIYEGFVGFFGNLEMTKIPNQDDRFSLYVAQIPCMCADKKYIYIISPPDNVQYGRRVLLHTLNWTSFQTRTSKVEYPDLQPQTYTPQSNHISQLRISQVSEASKKTTYVVDQIKNLFVDILDTSGYHTDGSIEEALETFNTVFYFR